MSEQVFQERHTCLVDCGLPAEQCACYMAEYELTHVDKADAWDAIVEKSREITRLRAALADAQAVGFAAGVEAAANSVKRHSDIARGKMSACYGQQDANSLVEWSAVVSHLDIEHDAIRALAPPDLTAAAARVLLPGMEQRHVYHMTSLGRDPEKYTSEYRMAAKALRAIAGDTP